MCHDIFLIDWFYLLFFFCKIIFFFVNPTVLHFLIRELNGNIEQIMWFDGTFMQMNFWKTSTHIIFVIRRAILHQVQVVEKWWFTLSEHQNPISRDGKFFFEVTLVFYYSDDNCLLAKSPTHFFAYQQGKFSDFTHFLFWKFFWNIQCVLLYCVKFL